MMQVFFLIFLLAGFFSGNCLAIEQPENARDMVVKMMQSMKELNYQGTVALFRNGKLETMRFSHAVNGGVKQERLLLMNSPVREMIRDRGLVRCIFKDSKKVVIDHRPVRKSFLMDVPEDLAEQEQFYRFEFAGYETIATLPTRIVVIEPRDKMRYARKIWISRNSFLPLKFELLNSSGHALEQAVFSDLNVKTSLPIVKFENKDDFLVQHIHQLEKIPFERARFELDNIPQGFKMIFYTRTEMHGKKELIDRVYLSDGFSVISIYIEKSDKDGHYAHRSIGAVNSYSKPLDQYQLTVMGEVPSDTVKYIVEGIRLKRRK